MNPRSEFAAHLTLNPQTAQTMRNLSALHAMRRDGWTIGRTFTRPAPVRPAAHTLAQRPTINDQVSECTADLLRLAAPVVLAVVSFVALLA